MSIFHFRAVEEDLEGYYYVRWDRAVPVQVEADTREKAYAKLWDLLGTPSRGRGWTWTARLDKVTAGCTCAAGGEQ